METQSSSDSYVSMLKARRMEEENSRKCRTNRRADVVSGNVEFYKKRSSAMRRRVMEEKLRMTSHIEHDLFHMLDEQSKWRHVMYQNVLNREKQHEEAHEQQKKLEETHLENLLEHEKSRFAETVQDDKTRWEEVLTIHEQARRRDRHEVCAEIVEDIVAICGDIIDFADQHSLEEDAAKANCSVLEVIPTEIVRDATLQRVYRGKEVEVTEALVVRHETQELYEGESVEHNVMFSSLVNKLLRLQFPTPAPFHPEKPMEKAIVVLLGPKYSGKSAVAKTVAERYGLMCVNDADLVEEALTEVSRDVTPEDLNDDSTSKLMELGRQARSYLLEGREIPTKLMIQLVLHRLRNVPDEFGGIILDGIPNTEEGFVELERELSSFDPHRCITLPEKLLAPLLEEINPDDAMFTLERPEQPPAEAGSPSGKEAKKEVAKPKKDKKKDEQEEPLPPIELPVVEPLPENTEEEQAALDAAVPQKDTTGVHKIVHVDCTTDRIFERFAGLRVDAETGAQYHIQFDPPPLDRVPHVVAKDRTEADTTKLHEALQRYGDRWLDARRWTEQFEGLLTCIDGNNTIEELTSQVSSMVENSMEHAQNQFEKMSTAATIKQQRAELVDLHAQRTEARENVRKQLAAVYTERGVDVLPPELQEPVKVVEEPKNLELPSRFPAMFLKVLDSFTEYYTVSLGSIQRELVTMMNRLYDQGTYNAKQFKAFWAQPDALQGVTDAFVAEFNTMQPALRRDVQGKEELHLRIDGIAENLHAIVDKRRDEGHNLVESLCNPTGYLDPWTDGVRILGAALAQLETERFFIVKHLSVMYFAALKNEQYTVEDGELALDVLPPPRGLQSEPTTPEPGQPKGKDKKPAPKKANQKVVEEPPADKPEDIVNAYIEKLTTAMKGSCERMTQAAQQPAATKGKKPQEPQEPLPPQAATHAAPIAQAEFEITKQRLAVIAEFTNRVTRNAVDRNSVVKVNVSQDLREKFVAQMSAANSVVYHLRCAVEEERPVLHRVHIAGDCFAIDKGHPLTQHPPVEAPAASKAAVAKVASLENVEDDTAILSCLTFSRAMEMLGLFKLIAPNFIIYRREFLRIVKQSDYTPADTESVSVDDLFSRFDTLRCDAIDWRDFLIHLLFWCEPQVKASTGGASPGAFGANPRNEYFVDGPSLLQLFDQRNDLASDLLTKDEFEEVLLFFEGGMSDERLICYRELLWGIFAVDSQLDPNKLVLFLCADPQPLRGVQKAFAMAAPVGDEACQLNVDMLFEVYHYAAVNAKAMGMNDPHDWENIEALLSGNEFVTFQELCGTHVGRVTLNNTEMYRRKRFTV